MKYSFLILLTSIALFSCQSELATIEPNTKEITPEVISETPSNGIDGFAQTDEFGFITSSTDNDWQVTDATDDAELIETAFFDFFNIDFVMADYAYPNCSGDFNGAKLEELMVVPVAKGSEIMIKVTDVTEEGIAHIQRSVDGVNYRTIASQPISITSRIQTVAHTDRVIADNSNGKIYYRAYFTNKEATTCSTYSDNTSVNVAPRIVSPLNLSSGENTSFELELALSQNYTTAVMIVDENKNVLHKFGATGVGTIKHVISKESHENVFEQNKVRVYFANLQNGKVIKMGFGDIRLSN